MEENFLTHLVFDVCLGSGAYGIVFRGTDKLTNVKSATKFVFKSHSLSEKEQRRLERESNLCGNLEHHGNIVGVFNTLDQSFLSHDIKQMWDPSFLTSTEQHFLRDSVLGMAKREGSVMLMVIQMELCGPTLRQWLNDDSIKSLDHKDLHFAQCVILTDFCEGLKFLHAHQIIHRDIKPENLMFSNGMEQYSFPLKLGDFGLSRVCHSEESATNALTSKVGTTIYMAPEVMRMDGDYGYQCDIFSFGLVTWEVVQLIPANSRRDMFHRLVVDKEHNLVLEHPRLKGMKKYIISMTIPKAKKRMTSLDEFKVVCEGIRTPRNGKELQECLNKSMPGDTIRLAYTRDYHGDFCLPSDNITLEGGNGTRIVGAHQLFALVVKGNGCNLSGISIYGKARGMDIVGNRNVVRKCNILLERDSRIKERALQDQPLLYSHELRITGNDNKVSEVTIDGKVDGYVEDWGNFNCVDGLAIILRGRFEDEFFQGSWIRDSKQVAQRRISLPKQLSVMTKLFGSTKPTNLSFLEVEESKILLESVICEGRFSLVFKATSAELPGQQLAVKISNQSRDHIKVGSEEIRILRLLGQHPNVVHRFGECTKTNPQGHLSLVLEYCCNGNLGTYLRQLDLPDLNLETKKSIQSDLSKWAMEIAAGMEFIHSKNIVYADLSARNVLLDWNRTAKISDFGRALELLDNLPNRIVDDMALNWRIMAPETMNRGEFSHAADVWSYGITLWEMFALGKVPNDKEKWSHKLEKKIRGGHRLPHPPLATDEIYSLMRNCWSYFPKDRPGFTALKDRFSQQSIVNTVCTEFPS